MTLIRDPPGSLSEILALDEIIINRGGAFDECIPGHCTAVPLIPRLRAHACNHVITHACMSLRHTTLPCQAAEHGLRRADAAGIGAMGVLAPLHHLL